MSKYILYIPFPSMPSMRRSILKRAIRLLDKVGIEYEVRSGQLSRQDIYRIMVNLGSGIDGMLQKGYDNNEILDFLNDEFQEFTVGEAIDWLCHNPQYLCTYFLEDVKHQIVYKHITSDMVRTFIPREQKNRDRFMIQSIIGIPSYLVEEDEDGGFYIPKKSLSSHPIKNKRAHNKGKTYNIGNQNSRKKKTQGDRE